MYVGVGWRLEIIRHVQTQERPYCGYPARDPSRGGEAIGFPELGDWAARDRDTPLHSSVGAEG